MNVAKDVGNAGSGKADLASCPALVEPKVKRLSLIDGKHVVKKGILVGEFDVGAGANDDHVRRESLVFLHHDRLRRWHCGRGWVQWSEPYHDVLTARSLL